MMMLGMQQGVISVQDWIFRPTVPKIYFLMAAC